MGGITEERVRLIIEAESAKAVRSLLETAKQQDAVEKNAKESARRKADIEQEYSRKVKQLGETRLQAVRREYQTALAEAEKHGAERADIEKYYSRQIADARRESIVSGADAAIGFGQKMTLGVTAPLLAAAGAGLKFAASIETQQARFSVLFGSAEKGTEVLEKLRTLGAETPLQLEDLTRATQTLAGFQAIGEDLTGTLRMIGDLAMGDAGKMQSLSLAYGQMTAAGKANMQDINQVINAGVPILDALKRKLGVETVAEVKKAVEQGMVSADMVKGAFQDLTGEGGLFNGMMLKISETTEGKLSTALDNLKNAGASAMEGLLPLAIDLLEGVSGAAQAFSELDEGSKKAILTLLGIAAGIGPVTAVTGTVIKLGAQLSKIKAIQSLVSAGALGPIGLAVGGLAALVTAIIAINASQKSYNKEQERTALAMKETIVAARSLGDQYATLAKNKQRTGDEELRLLELGKQLKEQYPGLTQEVLNRAVAEGRLADELERANRAKALEAYKETYNRLDTEVDKAEKKLTAARKELAEIEKGLAERQAILEESPNNRGHQYAAALWETYKQEQDAWLENQQIAYQKALNARDAFHRAFYESYTNQDESTLGEEPLPSSSTDDSPLVQTQGARLAALDAQYAKELEMAERTGQEVAAVERKYQQERLALLENFVREDTAKGATVAASLSSILAGEQYGALSEEFKQTLSRIAELSNVGSKAVGQIFDEAFNAWETGKEELGNRVAAGLLGEQEAKEAALRLSDAFANTIGAIDLSKLTDDQTSYFEAAVTEVKRLRAELSETETASYAVSSALSSIGGTLGDIAFAAARIGEALVEAFDLDDDLAGASKAISDFVQKNAAGLSALSSSVSSLYTLWRDSAQDAALEAQQAIISSIRAQQEALAEYSDRQLEFLRQNGEDTVAWQVRTNNEKKRLADKLAKEEDSLKRQQFEQEKQNKLAEIAIATAVAFAQALSTPLLAGFVATAGIAQAGIVASQKYTPLFDGGIIKGSFSGTQVLPGIIAAERGHDELVLPLRPERLRELGIGSGGNIYNLHIYPSATVSAEMAEEILQHIRVLEREGRGRSA
jgi:tape measure domain-containing protein